MPHESSVETRPNQALVEYTPEARGQFTLIENMRVERGTKADWDALHALHYKAESLPMGPQFYRCVTAEGDLVGIVVLSMVSLLLAPRHDIFPKLKPGKDTHFTNVHRARWLNSNMRRAARIVTDTLYRGVGVSYRMVNLAMRMSGFRFIEIQSSMSKYNPFDAKAGFRHAHLRQANAYEAGMSFFRRYFECHPADHQGILNELDTMSESQQNALVKAMRGFYYKHSAKEKTGANLNKGTGRVDGLTVSQLVKEMQQLVFATPAYGIWENPDLGRPIPETLPLAAFDWQAPNEPLNLEYLK